jgi:predicted CoA-binding protein
MNTDNHTDQEIKNFYNLKNIAIVGMSTNQEKPSHYVSKYLIQQGYNIIPVNPTIDEILNKRCYKMVSQIAEEVDIVDVFRKSEDVMPVVEDVIKKKGVKLIWLQKGIFSPKAEELAKKNGIDFIYNRCMLEEHQRLMLAEK